MCVCACVARTCCHAHLPWLSSLHPSCRPPSPSFHCLLSLRTQAMAREHGINAIVFDLTAMDIVDTTALAALIALVEVSRNVCMLHARACPITIRICLRALVHFEDVQYSMCMCRSQQEIEAFEINVFVAGVPPGLRRFLVMDEVLLSINPFIGPALACSVRHVGRLRTGRTQTLPLHRLRTS